MRYYCLSAVAFICLCLAQHAFAQSPAKITYADHVLPILRENCIACHNQDKSKGGLIVNNYTSLMQGSSSGEVVKPGEPLAEGIADALRLRVGVRHPQRSDARADFIAKLRNGSAWALNSRA